jgi:hypothetical protein
MSEDETFGLFPQIFSRYRESVNLLTGEFANIPYRDRAGVIHGLLAQCEAARNYKWPDKDFRERDRESIEGAKSAAIHAEKLAKYLRKHQTQTQFALMAAQENTDIRLWRKDETHSINQVEGFANLCDALAMELKGGNLFAKKGALMHRHQVGPLLFENPIDDRAGKFDQKTCLAIVLMLKLKIYEARKTMSFQAGEPMPAGDFSKWEIVHQLVVDAFHEKARANGVENLQRTVNAVLEKYPDLQILGYSRN